MGFVVHIASPKDLARIFRSVADDGPLVMKNRTVAKEFLGRR
jgi:hypothetical protein